MKVINLNNIDLLLPNSRVLLHSNNTEQSILNNYFDINFWKDNNQVIGQSKGRNITWFVQSSSSKSPWVLRHYYRGGLIAKLINDRYLYSSIKNTRVYKEIALLEKMIELGLPVPKPIAGRIINRGLFYSADLLMEKLDARDLVALLNESKLNEALWKAIGEAIADFHNEGIYHSDLNAHNIMIDNSNKVWLIDFDQCKQRLVKKDWQNNNIDRLNRSFIKEKKLNNSFEYCNSSWLVLHDAYLSRLV